MAFDFNSGRTVQDAGDTSFRTGAEHSFCDDPFAGTRSSAPKSAGFQNYPEKRKDLAVKNGSRPNAPVPSGNRGKAYRRPSVKWSSYLSVLPWDRILIIAAVIAAVAFCWIYREAITAFLTEVFTWVILIVIMVLLLKWIIFGRRR